MRRFWLAAAMFGTVSGAQAADMPDLPILRGAFTDGLNTSKVNWQGYYVGGQGGYGSSDENFRGSSSNMIAALLADTLIEQAMQVSSWNLGLGKQSSRSSAFGGFGGYNAQWDDVVLGLEASYLHGTFGGMASATEARSSGVLSDNFFHDVSATSSASIQITDMATFRARAGYAYDCILPYMFGGFALGNANITHSASVTDFITPGPNNSQSGGPLTPLAASETLHNHLVYGYTAGLGVDVNLVGGLFLRAEWEYVRFTSSVDTSINTIRGGLGYKF